MIWRHIMFVSPPTFPSTCKDWNRTDRNQSLTSHPELYVMETCDYRSQRLNSKLKAVRLKLKQIHSQEHINNSPMTLHPHFPQNNPQMINIISQYIHFHRTMHHGGERAIPACACRLTPSFFYRIETASYLNDPFSVSLQYTYYLYDIFLVSSKGRSFFPSSLSVRISLFIGLSSTAIPPPTGTLPPPPPPLKMIPRLRHWYWITPVSGQ